MSKSNNRSKVFGIGRGLHSLECQHLQLVPVFPIEPHLFALCVCVLCSVDNGLLSCRVVIALMQDHTIAISPNSVVQEERAVESNSGRFSERFGLVAAQWRLSSNLIDIVDGAQKSCGRHLRRAQETTASASPTKTSL
mmetsp:Transcript_18231/g.42221  ORF Transcript_18231/g.42221 Transcript_18231/m.42221 type:complete len:138 (-) Transcript_18231:219-632(-)